MPEFVTMFISTYCDSPGRMGAWRLADLILRSNGMPSDDASQRQLLVFMRTAGYVSADLQTAFLSLKATGPAGNHPITGAINIV